MMTPVRPMLATPTDHLPVGEGWVHEVKWDGQERWLDWATRVYLRYEVSESELSDEEGSDSELEEWS